MIDALIKRVSVTYKCYEMYTHLIRNVAQLGNIITVANQTVFAFTT
jgi:hypothetical protein